MLSDQKANRVSQQSGRDGTLSNTVQKSRTTFIKKGTSEIKGLSKLAQPPRQNLQPSQTQKVQSLQEQGRGLKRFRGDGTADLDSDSDLSAPDNSRGLIGAHSGKNKVARMDSGPHQRYQNGTQRNATFQSQTVSQQPTSSKQQVSGVNHNTRVSQAPRAAFQQPSTRYTQDEDEFMEETECEESDFQETNYSLTENPMSSYRKHSDLSRDIDGDASYHPDTGEEASYHPDTGEDTDAQDEDEMLEGDLEEEDDHDLEDAQDENEQHEVPAPQYSVDQHQGANLASAMMYSGEIDEAIDSDTGINDFGNYNNPTQSQHVQSFPYNLDQKLGSTTIIGDDVSRGGETDTESEVPSAVSATGGETEEVHNHPRPQSAIASREVDIEGEGGSEEVEEEYTQEQAAYMFEGVVVAGHTQGSADRQMDAGSLFDAGRPLFPPEDRVMIPKSSEEAETMIECE
ncbi:hypothetical protein HDU93_004695 [Gonapodya sp. JEL0774]|nr:hypothetical protein HDU93_004695 [Gonapodya sp. JEL0774]